MKAKLVQLKFRSIQKFLKIKKIHHKFIPANNLLNNNFNQFNQKVLKKMKKIKIMLQKFKAKKVKKTKKLKKIYNN